MHANEWKIPFNIALAFHILVALAVIFLPRFMSFHPKDDMEALSVQMVSLSDLAPPAPAEPASGPAGAKEAAKPPPPPKPEPKSEPKPEPKPQPPPPKPPEPEKAVSIAEKPPIEKPPPEAISIKPAKKKIVKEVPPEPKPEPKPPDPKKVEKVEKPDPKLKEMEKQKVKSIADAIRAEQHAQDEARSAAEEAANLKKLLDAEKAIGSGIGAGKSTNASQSTSSSTSQSAGSSGQDSAAFALYKNALFSRIQSFWQLPEFKEWSPSLNAKVAITVSKTGEILDTEFLQSSGDKAFDQAVTKTLHDSNPLPPIPAALNKQRIVVEIKFSPGSIR